MEQKTGSGGYIVQVFVPGVPDPLAVAQAGTSQDAVSKAQEIAQKAATAAVRGENEILTVDLADDGAVTVIPYRNIAAVKVRKVVRFRPI